MKGCARKRHVCVKCKQCNKCHKCKGPCGSMTGGCKECFMGGSAQKGGSGVPAPLVGAPWTGKISSWPGVAGNPGQTNYLALNQYKSDVQLQMQNPSDISNPPKQTGGKLDFSDFENLGRSFTYGFGSGNNILNGYKLPVNPLPYMDQMNGRR